MEIHWAVLKNLVSCLLAVVGGLGVWESVLMEVVRNRMSSSNLALSALKLNADCVEAWEKGVEDARSGVERWMGRSGVS